MLLQNAFCIVSMVLIGALTMGLRGSIEPTLDF
jgi:hypothetical protein